MSNLNITEAIALRMKQLAHERHISLNELSKRAKINQSTISEIMQGRSKHPRVSTIQKFCEGCGISMSEFFDSPLFDSISDVEPTMPTDLFEFAAKMPPKNDNKSW